MNKNDIIRKLTVEMIKDPEAITCKPGSNEPTLYSAVGRDNKIRFYIPSEYRIEVDYERLARIAFEVVSQELGLEIYSADIFSLRSGDMNLKNIMYFCAANKIKLSFDYEPNKYLSFILIMKKEGKELRVSVSEDMMILPDFDERIDKELNRMLWVLNNYKNELKEEN